jgi:hypothetical protein
MFVRIFVWGRQCVVFYFSYLSQSMQSTNSTDPTLKELFELIDDPISCGFLHVCHNLLDHFFLNLTSLLPLYS